MLTLSPPILLIPKNDETETVSVGTELKWNGQLGPGECSTETKWGECFSLRVWKEDPEETCFHTQLRETEFMVPPDGLGHCETGTHFWQVGIARKVDQDPPWVDISEPSETWQFHYNAPNDQGEDGPTSGE
jgi:hypothetical protein